MQKEKLAVVGGRLPSISPMLYPGRVSDRRGGFLIIRVKIMIDDTILYNMNKQCET